MYSVERKLPLRVVTALTENSFPKNHSSGGCHYCPQLEQETALVFTFKRGIHPKEHENIKHHDSFEHLSREQIQESIREMVIQ